MAFVTRYASYLFYEIPFRLSNAPTYFLKCMNNVFSSYINCILVVCIDDILMYNESLRAVKSSYKVFPRLDNTNFM